MTSIEKNRMLELRGEQLADSEGEKVGKLEEIYLDADSGEPEWALVHTGLFGTKRTFVPLAGATEEDGQLRVPLDEGRGEGRAAGGARRQADQGRGVRALRALRHRAARRDPPQE